MFTYLGEVRKKLWSRWMKTTLITGLWLDTSSSLMKSVCVPHLHHNWCVTLAPVLALSVNLRS